MHTKNEKEVAKVLVDISKSLENITDVLNLQNEMIQTLSKTGQAHLSIISLLTERVEVLEKKVSAIMEHYGRT